MYKNVCVVFRISYQAPNSENSSVSLHQVTSVHVHVVSDYFYHNTSLTHSIKIRNAKQFPGRTLTSDWTLEQVFLSCRGSILIIIIDLIQDIFWSEYL